MIVAPQLGGNRQHNYSTKTRQAGHANEQSMYSLMSMGQANSTGVPTIQKSKQKEY